MLDFNPLFEFSRDHCIAICAVLVPANLLATLQTMIFTGLGRSFAQVRLMAAVSSIYAALLLLHVWTWFAIGVVMAPTFILTFLGCVCLTINIGAVILSSRNMGRLAIDRWNWTAIVSPLRHPIFKSKGSSI